MTLAELKTFLGWLTLINYGILVFWFFNIIVLKEAVFRIHSSIFKMTMEQFNVIHYCGLGLFKLLIFVFNLAPYCVLLIMDV